jgi:hypothetical protein
MARYRRLTDEERKAMFAKMGYVRKGRKRKVSKNALAAIKDAFTKALKEARVVKKVKEKRHYRKRPVPVLPTLPVHTSKNLPGGGVQNDETSSNINLKRIYNGFEPENPCSLEVG